MPEPLKNLFNTRLVSLMGDHLQRADPAFPREAFVAAAGNGGAKPVAGRAAEHRADEVAVSPGEDVGRSGVERGCIVAFRGAPKLCQKSALRNFAPLWLNAPKMNYRQTKYLPQFLRNFSSLILIQRS